MKTEFYPKSTTYWCAVEYHPVGVVGVDADGREICEVVEEGTEHFWSVYIHLVSGGLSCVADVETKEQAIALTELIENLVATQIK